MVSISPSSIYLKKNKSTSNLLSLGLNSALSKSTMPFMLTNDSISKVLLKTNSLSDEPSSELTNILVDSVVSFGTDDELRNCIKEYEPDVMVIGGEYKYKEIIGLEHVPHIEFFDKIEGISTTKILRDEK